MYALDPMDQARGCGADLRRWPVRNKSFLIEFACISFEEQLIRWPFNGSGEGWCQGSPSAADEARRRRRRRTAGCAVVLNESVRVGPAPRVNVRDALAFLRHYYQFGLGAISTPVLVRPISTGPTCEYLLYYDSFFTTLLLYFLAETSFEFSNSYNGSLVVNIGIPTTLMYV